MLLHRLLVEFTTTVSAGDQHANISIFVRLFVLLVVQVGVLVQHRFRSDRWGWRVLLLLLLLGRGSISTLRLIRLVRDLLGLLILSWAILNAG
jgi:hypothetical protein